jgi:chorismate lyase/3-hydroxybenzoate synthase
VENPRQVSAWRYPRQYGPNAPAFARGMRSPSLPPQLHVSGTAAVVGHASQHDEDLAAQIAETFANLDSLFHSAGTHGGFGAHGLVKAYLRHADAAGAVADALARRMAPGTPILLLEGDICRRELLVEIDGVQGG